MHTDCSYKAINLCTQTPKYYQEPPCPN
ncbi:hypothetical protein TGAM01_v205056 [Trichoderma gamsii]|uniref:Uncharacterized protein n=1 Tax=Trichoderma gamsii TaxID=398673 RepID=A0A2P4ZP98_9HYPO|nr:hypothetical protein TGAM01_v205056 [Trichoderma gamsii]